MAARGGYRCWCNLRTLLVLGVLGVLGGCRPRIANTAYNVTVNSYASPTAGQYKTYVVVPGRDPVDALEFDEFSRELRAVLNDRHLRPSRVDQADLIIRLEYEVGPPRTYYYTVSTPIWGQTGVSSSTTTAQAITSGNTTAVTAQTQYSPRFGVTGYKTDLRSYTSFSRYIALKAFDGARQRGRQELMVWETRIGSEGTNADLRTVFPAMLAAASDFVGSNTGGAVDRRLPNDAPSIASLRAAASLDQDNATPLPDGEPSNYSAACAQDDLAACLELGTLLTRGRPGSSAQMAVAQDFTKAGEALRYACDRRNESACRRLGLLYRSEKIADPGHVGEVWAWATACERGDNDACWITGSCYERGVGVEADRSVADTYYRWACAGGTQSACAAVSHEHVDEHDAPRQEHGEKDPPASVGDAATVPRWFAAPPSSAQLRTTAKPALANTDVYRRVAPSVYTVRVFRNGRRVGHGSAVAVAPSYLITNWHVAKEGDLLTIDQGRTAWPATVLAADPDRDLCWLRLKFDDTKLQAVRGIRTFESLGIGEAVYSMGTPSDEVFERSLAAGIISGKREEFFVQTTAAISPGSSGGGLFDAQGNLVGITVGSVPDSQSLNLAIRADAFWEGAAKDRPSTNGSNP